ncbi:MAG: metallophosphoesterase [Nitrospirae bacterium]|nr:metallophosphoesterase [Nitrospirota bacterium]
MPEPASYKLVIISDLHLSEGWDENGYLSRNEDFFFDQNFKRFLEYFSGEAKRGGFFYKLIINGDFVDFLQVVRKDLLEREFKNKRTIDGEKIFNDEVCNLGFGTGPAKTIWKLKHIVNGHPIFFVALATFLAEGHKVIIIPGNHDIEWIMPNVQEAFRERVNRCLEEYIKKSEPEEFKHLLKESLENRIKENIHFNPWFYYDKELSTYIEHGSQYDEINSFDYFLCPCRQEGTIDLPAGSFFVRYLFNKVEEDYPFADNMKPLTKFIFWALCRFRTYRGCPPRILKYLSFFWNILKKTKRIDKNWAKVLEENQEAEIKNLPRNSGMCKKKILKLKKHWVPSAIHKNWCTLICSFKNNSKLDRYYYRKKADGIHQIIGARYVVFGHTHEADLSLLSETDGKKNEYINSGTWTKSFAANFEEALLKSENEFVYVHIGYDTTKKDVKMELLRWNDSIREGERVRLFKEKT